MDFDIIPNPLVQDAVDIKMYAGEEHYTVGEFIREARDIGVSKRIPKTAIPEGIVPGVSRIFIAHNKAILICTAGDIRDLADDLTDLDLLNSETKGFFELVEPWGVEAGELLPDDFVPEQMINLVMAFEDVEPDISRELIKKYGIEFQPGIIGWSYLTGLQYVLPKGENELPAELAHIEHLEPVYVEYEQDLEINLDDDLEE